MIRDFLMQHGEYHDDRRFKELTTVRMGGPIRHFVMPYSVEDVKEIIGWLKTNHIAFKVIGNGSNLICGESSYDGVIINLKNLNGYEIRNDEAYVEALKSFSDPNIVLNFKSGDAVHQKNDVFKGIMWYSYTNDKGNIMAIPVDKVKEIIAMNKKGQKPEKLEDYAVTMETQTNTNEGYGEADLKKMSD